MLSMVYRVDVMHTLEKLIMCEKGVCVCHECGSAARC